MRGLLSLALLLSLPLTAAAQDAHAQTSGDHGVLDPAMGDDHGSAGEATGEHADVQGGHGASVDVVDVMTGETKWQFWGAILNFAILMGLFVYFGRKPLKGFLSARRKGVEEGLAEAQRLTAAANAKYEEYSDRLSKLDGEIEAIRADMVRAGEAERDRIVSEAEAKAARLRRETDFLIEQQMKQLRVDLTQETVEAAVAAAEAVLRASTNASDQERLAKIYLERLQEEAQKEQRA